VAAVILSCLCTACGEEKTAPGDARKKLPAPDLEGGMSVAEAIAARRSVRVFEPSPLTDEALSQLLFAAQGITDQSRGFRAAPSAGATYPLETWVITAEGVFRYDVSGHALRRISTGDQRGRLSSAALGQKAVAGAPLSIVFTSVDERTERRYGERASRYIAIEAGHAAQNILLQAVALGLGAVPIGAFDEDAIAEVLGCQGEERPLYIIAAGKPG
jgi:SagB-type dehydrogenase family enzyme